MRYNHSSNNKKLELSNYMVTIEKASIFGRLSTVSSFKGHVIASSRGPPGYGGSVEDQWSMDDRYGSLH